MKFLKIIRVSSLIATIISFLSPLISISLSSIMQSYYKGRIGGADTAEILAKKKFWVNLGESEVFYYFYYAALGFALVFILSLIIFAILKKRKINY